MQPPGEQIAQELMSALEGFVVCFFFPGGGTLFVSFTLSSRAAIPTTTNLAAFKGVRG